MDNLHDEIVLDYPFLNHCYSRFKSPANALRHLEKVGNPPKVVSTKRRSPEIETAVEFLACLVAHNAFVDHDGHDNGALSHISSRRNGIAIFVSWVLFLLTNVVLAEELPTTIDGVKAPGSRSLLRLYPLLDWFSERSKHPVEHDAFIPFPTTAFDAGVV
ncbi:hypothetical protein AAF712_007691 [Marasmius tenuissimus]|uniref:Uncharacterized protein n=1 Tax=Marasmius tenuissimus TaxID=585030 RepID=A0ABR2ZUG0_9AGAR